MEDSILSTEFEVVSKNDPLRFAISISLEESVRNWLTKEISWNYYRKNKINIQGFDDNNYSDIDISKNEALMDFIVKRLLQSDSRPAADFILHWADSSKLIVRDRKHMQTVSAMVINICDSEMRNMRRFSDKLYVQFRKMEDNYLNCTSGIRFFDEG